MDVTQTTTSALCDQQQLTDFRHVTDDLEGFLVDHGGADRHLDDQILTRLACHLAALTGIAALRLIVALELEVDQGIERVIPDQVHTAAVPAIAPIGTTARHVFFTAKTQATIAATSGLYNDRRFIKELHAALS